MYYACQNGDSDLVFSVASVWEMQIRDRASSFGRNRSPSLVVGIWIGAKRYPPGRMGPGTTGAGPFACGLAALGLTLVIPDQFVDLLDGELVQPHNRGLGAVSGRQ